MYRLVFMRHGRSLADDEQKHEGSYDSLLTEVGVNQAIETALYLSKKYKFDCIITSPLKRAKQTAEIIQEKTRCSIDINPLFRERDNGILAGMKYEEAKKKYPLPKIDGPFRRFPGNTGENEFELNARALLALNSIIDKGPGSYLIVSHGGILNAVIKRIMDIPIGNKESGVVFRLGDNGFIEVEYREEKNLWIIKRMEDGK